MIQYQRRKFIPVNLEQDKLDLIEEIIKSDRKYSDNEDLYEDFFNETCKRSMGIINIVSSDTTLRAYIKKIATTSILNVLKNSGRMRRTKSGFVPTQEVSIEDSDNYKNIEISYMNFGVEESPEDIAVQKDIIKQVFDAVSRVAEEDSEKQYLQIYKLRYDKGMTQKEISEELGLSQSEVSKRLFKLMENVKKSFR